MEHLVREVTDIQLNPNNMNKEENFHEQVMEVSCPNPEGAKRKNGLLLLVLTFM
jgi:hypothetical protein